MVAFLFHNLIAYDEKLVVVVKTARDDDEIEFLKAFDLHFQLSRNRRDLFAPQHLNYPNDISYLTFSAARSF